MLRGSRKIIKLLSVWLVSCVITTGIARADEITAIDFQGNLLGKVLPDGVVVNFENKIIGNVTADSLIVNQKGNPIGGVVPQGVSIGVDNKLLGKINSDGLVRAPSGNTIGKVLPSGLIIDPTENVIGAVLYPGLIYNDEGRTVGRLAGDGSYVNLEGRNIGFVSSSGYAYRQSGDNYILDGRLIPSKMVISLDGAFLGSVAPGGRVTDFEGKNIGQVHASGFVYNSEGEVIGAVVLSGYAFDMAGKYLGIITYNGQVMNKTKNIGHLRADGVVVNNEGKELGFRADFSATATDLRGRYLGYLTPQGQVVFAGKTIGFVGAKGVVRNNDNVVIGQLVQAGPIFDSFGKLIGQITDGGKVNTLSGSPLGYAKGKIAYSGIGRPLGSVLNSMLVFDAAGNILGLSGINSTLNLKGSQYLLSPEGYVYTPEGQLLSRAVALQPVFKQDAEIQAYISANGKLQGVSDEINLKLTPLGAVLNKENNIDSMTSSAQFAVSENGELLGSLLQNNTILNATGALIAKVLPAHLVASATEVLGKNLMPIIGSAHNLAPVLGINGSSVGSVDILGVVRDFSGNIIGQALSGGIVGDSKKSMIGFLADSATIVNPECSFVGVVDQSGEVKNARDVVLGKYLANKQVVSETGEIVGYGVSSGIVLNDAGESLGLVNPLNEVMNYKGEKVGCLNSSGRLINAENVWIGAIVQPFPVMDFENYMIGRVLPTGRVVDEQSADIGFIQPDGTFISKEDGISGVIFKYKFAFDLQNTYLGRVNEKGLVVSDAGETIGKVNFDGAVFSEDKSIGYALNDLYVYDENGNTIGYILSNGEVQNFANIKLGKIDKGFLVNSENKLIARGARDYQIREAENQVIGEIRLNGNVVNKQGEVIGTVTGSGQVLNTEGDVLGMARPLQFYNISAPEEKKSADWAGTPTRQVGALTPAEQEFNTGMGLKSIGIALTPDGNYLGEILENNNVIDKLGNVLGTLNDGLVVDAEGNLIGMEEVKNPEGQQMFVPAGTFGDGGAYGIGNTPTNLGPGGGFGPGERYDPVRSAALAAAQAQRRTDITVGQLSTNVDKRSFDGMQDNWDGVPRRLSTWRVDMSEMILADKPIPAVLARTIMSSDGADDVPVTAIVERNVYAEKGRNIIIPAGSRVMGQSSGLGGSGTSGGAVRVNITWTRLIRPDGSAFEFSAAKTGDAQGRGGALAYLDEQLLKRYTLPIVTSVLSSSLAYVTATDDNGTTTGESSLESSRQQAANDARQQFLQNMDQVFQQILQDKTDIQAITYVPAGTRLIIYPKEDLWIRTLERSQQEEYEKKMTNGKGPLIDGQEGKDDGNDNGNSGLTGTGSSSGTTSRSVVYLDEDVNAKPTGGGLVDDGGSTENKKRQPNIPAVTVTGATPPPPSSSATNLPPAATTTQQRQNTTTGAQLF